MQSNIEASMDEVRAGEFFQSKHNNLYQVITVATHAETRQKLVVYQELFGTFSVYALPIEIFFSDFIKQSEPKLQVDSTKKTVEQKSTEMREEQQDSKVKPQRDKLDNKYCFIDENPKTLMDFLDATTDQERLNILHQMQSYIDSYTLDSITVSLDYVPYGTSLDERFYSVCKYLEMKINYESRRK